MSQLVGIVGTSPVAFLATPVDSFPVVLTPNKSTLKVNRD